MTIIHCIGALNTPILPSNEAKKSENASNAERDVNNLINNLVRQGLGHYRTQDRDYPCVELADRAQKFLRDEGFKADTIGKIQSYLKERYSPLITYSEKELRGRIEARLKKSCDAFNLLAKRPEFIGGANNTLRRAIEHHLNNN